MKKKETTICEKQVTLAYCYATEISFKKLSGRDINDFVIEAAKDIQDQRMPDAEQSIYIILAAIIAYYDDPEKAPVKDVDLMKNATPGEIGTAIGTIFRLRTEFYEVPSGEPEDNAKGPKRKNA